MIGRGTQEGRSEDLSRIRQKFVRRRWARRWKLWRIVTAILVSTVLLGLAAWQLLFADTTYIDEVEVTGSDVTNPVKVREVAQLPTDVALIRLDLEAAERRVGSMLPVKDVSISRRWPDKVEIALEERVAVATVMLNRRWRGMDTEGVLFRKYKAKLPPAAARLPRISADEDVEAGALREAGDVIAALPQSIEKKVTIVNVESRDAISLTLRNGRVVEWGSAAESEVKAQVLEVLLQQPGRVLDVSVPAKPTTRK